jgi:site-specific DNA-methyltransferase (adenine-specific)
VVTSPPYFNLKEYNKHPGQLGEMNDYEAFHDALDEVWKHGYRVLVPGGGYEAATIAATRKNPR